MNLARIQEALQNNDLDGWLFYDFQNRDAIAYRILKLDIKKMTSRRWYYFIPTSGIPIKLVHSIESGKLDSLPGEKQIYLPWLDQHEKLRGILGKSKRIAMQYSPNNAIPYISLVDGGTIELVRSFGVEVVSSADLVQLFEAKLDEAAFFTHKEAGCLIHDIMDRSFQEVARRIKDGQHFTEYDIQQFIVREFENRGLTCEGEFPIVGVNAHAADPHYEPSSGKASPIKEGDLILLDIWAKLNQPGAIYFDITWTGYIGNPIPQRYIDVFNIVRDGRDRAVEFINKRLSKSQSIYGWEVDDACRKVITDRGYGQYFIHRTGHSIGEKVHGNGVHIDNLETKDGRCLMPGILFSVEPGIYLTGDFGIRSEINVFINNHNQVEITGPVQKELVKVLEF